MSRNTHAFALLDNAQITSPATLIPASTQRAKEDEQMIKKRKLERIRR
jgi:hypothetical protein